MEIERKYLIREFPDNVKELTLDCEGEVHQAYLSTGNPSVRILSYNAVYPLAGKTVKEYRMTVKSDGHLEREEVEIIISESQYQDLLRLLNKTPIHKKYKRYLMPEDPNFSKRLKLEVAYVNEGSMYNTSYAFRYCEVEFETSEEVYAFKVPDYLKDYLTSDITFEPGCKMKSYWDRLPDNRLTWEE